MASWFRSSLFSSLGLLWVTGCVWLVLHYFFQVPTDFGTAPHPLQPSLIAVHGVLAIAAVFFFGWIAGTHVGDNWGRKMNRTTGIVLISLGVLLVLTGLGSYYLTSENLRPINAAIHEIAGVLAVVPALVHWLRNRRPVSRRPQ